MGKKQYRITIPQQEHNRKGSGCRVDSDVLSMIRVLKDNAQGKFDSVAEDEYGGTIKRIKDNRLRKNDIKTVRNVLEVWQRSEEHVLRKRYLRLSFCLVGFVIYISLTVVVLSGIQVIKLEQPVQIAMLTTMVANVIGILLTAMIWLYKKNDVAEGT